MGGGDVVEVTKSKWAKAHLHNISHESLCNKSNGCDGIILILVWGLECTSKPRSVASWADAHTVANYGKLKVHPLWERVPMLSVPNLYLYRRKSPPRTLHDADPGTALKTKHRIR
jgi:hypothetical protein